MPVYSHSRLSSFEKCPLQYRYRYIDRIKRDTQGIEAFMGIRVHEAIEHLYRALGDGRTPRTEEVVAVYHQKWEAQYSAARVRIVRRGYCAADYRASGEACVRRFCASRSDEGDGETLGLEDKFQLALDAAGRYQITGVIDRLARAGDGVYEVHDYKTSSFLPTEEALRRDRQLTFYQISVGERYPDAKAIRLVWHFLMHGRRLESRRNEAEITSHRKATLRLIDLIEATRDHPPRESALCRWCEYRDICPVQKAQVAAEQRREERASREAAEKRLTGGVPRAGRAEQLALIPPPARPRPPAG